MANENRNPYTSSVNLNIWIENLPRLYFHFPLLFSSTVLHKDINMRNDIKRYLFGKLIFCYWIIYKNSSGLIK